MGKKKTAQGSGREKYLPSPLRAADHIGPDPRSGDRLKELQGPLPLQTRATAADGSTEGEDIGLKLTSDGAAADVDIEAEIVIATMWIQCDDVT